MNRSPRESSVVRRNFGWNRSPRFVSSILPFILIAAGTLSGECAAQPVSSLVPSPARQAAPFDPKSFAGDWVRSPVIRDGIARLVMEQTGATVRGTVELPADFQNIDGSVLLAAGNHALDGTIEADGRMKFTFGPFAGTMSLGRTGRSISGSMTCPGGPFLGFVVTLERSSGPPIAGPLRFVVPLRPARPITSEQVDKFLDHLGDLLQTAADVPDPRVFTPLRCSYRDPAGASQTSWHQAAELARSVFDQVRSIQTQANRGVIPLTGAQIKRLKAFIHWVDWLIKRGEKNVGYFPVSVPDGPTRRVLHWEVAGDGLFKHWEKFPDPPEYPLDEPITGDVPPPNLRDIVEDDDATIMVEEYGRAFFMTVAQCADMYYTYGLISSLHLFLSSDQRLEDGIPLALSVLCFVPRAGPHLAAIAGTIIGAAHWDNMSWDQRYGMLSGIFLMGLNASRSGVKPTEKANPSLGANESPIPRSVTDRPPGDYSIRVKNRSGPAGELAEIEAMAPGRIDGRPPGPDTPVTLRTKAVKSGQSERHFLETGEPIISAGDEGYQAWLTLTGRHYGQNTGRSPLIQALKGTRFEAEAQAIVDGFLQPHADRIALNQRFVELANKLVADDGIPRTSGYYPDGPGVPSNAAYSLQIKNAAGEIHLVEVAVESGGKLAKVSVVPPTPATPLPEAAGLAQALAKPRNSSPWKAIRELFDSPEAARLFRKRMVKMLKEEGGTANDAADIAATLVELRDLPGIRRYIKDLEGGDSTAAAATWELRWALKNKSQIRELQVMEGAQKGADFLLNDGNIVELKAYDWSNKLYRSPKSIDQVADSWAKQLAARAEKYPDSELRVVVLDKAQAPAGPGGKSLPDLVLDKLSAKLPGVDRNRVKFEDFDYR